MVGGGSVSVTISGTAQEVLAKLQAVKEITRNRNEEGFRIYQPDEDWTYIPIYDERLCPVCEGFGGRWNGAQVGVEFTDIENIHPFRSLMINERYPNTHTTYPWLKGDCRCLLQLNDYMFIFHNRLVNEMLAAVT